MGFVVVSVLLRMLVLRLLGVALSSFSLLPWAIPFYAVLDLIILIHEFEGGQNVVIWENLNWWESVGVSQRLAVCLFWYVVA